MASLLRLSFAKEPFAEVAYELNYRKYAVELMALGPDVILASTTPAVVQLQQASRTVPIVFVSAIDPVGSGLLTSSLLIVRDGSPAALIWETKADSDHIEGSSRAGANAVVIQVLPIIGNPTFTTGPAALSFASAEAT
jgi:hypothetical protein